MRLSPVLDRIGTYPFVRLDEARERVEARGIEVIDLGMGDPREPPEEHVVRALVDALPLVDGYPRAHGLPELRAAIARWAERRFRVPLDPDSEIVPTLGSKEAIFSLAQVVIDRDSGRAAVAYTEPGYPVYERGALFAGAEPRPLPLLEDNGFLPDLDDVEWDDISLLWLNYPNNPTGAVAPLSFLAEAAELARAHDVVLACDEAYSELWFEEPPASALQLADRTNVLVFNTLSKRSSMTGYRSGFGAGDPALIAALKAFRPTTGTAPQDFVQRASVVAWDDEEHVERARTRYREKRELFLELFARKGIRLAGSRATIYLWAEVPAGQGSEEFAARLLECGVLVSPGSYFGPSGEGYFRISLVPLLEDCRRAVALLDEALPT